MEKILRDDKGRFLKRNHWPKNIEAKRITAIKKSRFKVPKICPYCGKKFIYNNEKSQKLCSRACAHKFAKGQRRSLKTEFRYKNGLGYRHWFLKEAFYACEKCGLLCSKKEVEVHHKDENRMNNKIKNLEKLCKICHRKTHELLRAQDR